MKISQNIIDARNILSDLERLNANPELIDKQIMYDKAIDLDIIAQQIIIKTAKMLDL